MDYQKDNGSTSDFIPVGTPDLVERSISKALDVLKSGWLTTGEICESFEDSFSKFIKVKHAVSISSCTQGLAMIMELLNLTSSDEVITSAWTFVSVANVIVRAGAKLVLVDIEAKNLNMDTDQIISRINTNTKAIVVPHYSGIVHRDIQFLKEVCDRQGICLIEDCAHSVGASIFGEKAGSLGHVGVFSFYANKILSTGEGGMITTNDDILAQRLRELRLHGMDKDAIDRYREKGGWRYDVVYPGTKNNLTDIQAAIGMGQLEAIETLLGKRWAVAQRYREAFNGLEGVGYLDRGGSDVWWNFPIFVDNILRDSLITKLLERRIGTSVHFIPIYHFSYYKRLFPEYKKDYVNSELISQSIMSIPMFADLNREQQERVISSVKELIQGGA